MADTNSKIDEAAQKAYADASSKKTNGADDARFGGAKSEGANSEVDIGAIADAVENDTPSADIAKIVDAVEAEPKAPATQKTVSKKTASHKSAPNKVAAKTFSNTSANASKKEKIMTEVQDKTTDYSAQVKDGVADLQARAKTAYGKGSEIAAEMGTFTKGNVEAVVESGKIFASGMQDIGKTYVADAKTAVEVVTADVKEVAAVRSPTELMQLQTKIASRNFDATVAAVSKNAEAWIKLTNEAFAPISGRMSVAMDKVRQAA